MSNTQPPKAYAKDYAFTALLSSLSYDSRLFSSGQSGASLAKILKDGGNIEANFISAGINIDNFSAQYEVVASIAPTLKSQNGGNVIAFRNIGTGDIAFSVAGVSNGVGELKETVFGTEATGFNVNNYADVKSVYTDLVSRFPGAKFDLIGHSLGGQMVQILTAQFSLDKRLDQVLTTTTFGSYGVKFYSALSPNTDPTAKSLLNELDRIDETTPFTHFFNDSDAVPMLSQVGVQNLWAGGAPIRLEDGIFLDGLGAHQISTYIKSLGAAEKLR
jgi:hypothetical protein